MKTSKIRSSAFTNEWGTGSNKTFFHDIELEGENRKFNIGAKSASPAFLAAGQTLNWEFKDEAKGSIKKVNPQQGPGQSAPSSSGGAQVILDANRTDIKVSTGLIAATILLAAGKIKKEQVNEIAANVVRHFDEVKALLG